MKSFDLPYHQSAIDLLSNDNLWGVIGSAEHTVELATKTFWLDPVHFKLALKVKIQILHLAPDNEDS